MTVYKIHGWPGVAVHKIGPYLVADDDTEWTGEMVETGMVEVIMVGDDVVHFVDPEDLIEINDDEFCPECGQIGCGGVR